MTVAKILLHCLLPITPSYVTENQKSETQLSSQFPHCSTLIHTVCSGMLRCHMLIITHVPHPPNTTLPLQTPTKTSPPVLYLVKVYVNHCTAEIWPASHKVMQRFLLWALVSCAKARSDYGLFSPSY